MPAEDKHKLVEELVDLSVRDVMNSADLSSNLGNEITSRMRGKIRQEQIDLRMKHFEIDQIKALLEFYRTEMGKSILESQSRIEQELAEGISVLSAEVNQEVLDEIQAGRLNIKPGKHRGGDT